MTRQPVHTVYVGAHQVRADTVERWGALARETLAAHAPDAKALAAAVLVPEGVPHDALYDRVQAKLAREPVEDLRVDFEDGYGVHPDADEDATAVAAAHEIAAARADGTAPLGLGLRIKALSGDVAPRALRTLELFVGELRARAGDRFPRPLAVTLPKITAASQVTALAEACDALERRHGLRSGTLTIELMVETPQALFDEEGRCPLRAFVRAAAGRCSGAHFGVYDYTTALGITAAHQRMRHPACDLARGLMQAALAGTGVPLSDGSTNVLPVGDAAAVRRAWRSQFKDVRHSLACGFYQGWDLHPAQLPVRFAGVYSFYLESRDAAAARLSGCLAQADAAAHAGAVWDDAATGQALLNYFVRGFACGALSEEDVGAAGVRLEDLRIGVFADLLQQRRAASP